MSELARLDSTRLKGRYEVLETLGTGGEARVVKALDQQHERVVALKIRTAHSSVAREALLREARVLLGLPSNPALPLVREDFFDDDRYVVVMDWVDGTDLATLLRDRGTPGLAPSSVLAYLAEVAEALTFLHTQEPPVVHGDVKPANLILTRGGRVKLVDFGLSSAMGVGWQRAGTAGFRAPELATGAAPSRSSDIYALAATAFALLTGSPPAGVLPTWEGFDPSQAAQLERVIREGLATDPTRRPATAGEFLERLRAGWGSTLPTGVLTFCMSDIVGSTALWEAHPELMAPSLVRHDELVAQAIESMGGRFLKSMGEGDSTVSVFESASQAVGAAVDTNRVLAAESWPDGVTIAVRFGVHTGEAEQRGGDYFGTTVNVAARVRGEAHGGEILLSDATAGVVGRHLPAGYSLIDLGPHRLKGLAAPERIRALVGPGLVTTAAVAECPYRGLRAFGPDNRELFFGRDGVIADVLGRIAPGCLLALVGASGSGKSSVLGAGVIGAVWAGEVSGVTSARLITPGSEPPVEIEGGGSALLVVDQFEELYTQCQDPERRMAFIDYLLARSGPVVIGVRADFYGELTTHARLAHAVANNQIPLGPMNDDDLRRAVAEPARIAGLRLEPGLTDIVLSDVAGEPGALPLMSHALRATWERRDGRTLTIAAYRRSGGVSSAVAQTADAVIQSIPEDSRPLMRSVFLRLTEFGDGVEDTRRRVPLDELTPQGASSNAIKPLLERLADARLLTLGDGTAEVAHEVLIREWPMLRRWLEEDRDGIRLHRRLGDAARLWESSGRESTDLYRGTRLDAALDWAHTNPTLLNDVERTFLDSSLEATVRERGTQLRINRRLRRALAGAGALILLALALLVFALISRHDAVGAQASAYSRALAQSSESQLARDPQASLLLARDALQAAPTPAAQLAASEALDANTLRSQQPSLGLQPCESFANQLVVYDSGRRAALTTCKGDVAFEDLLSHRVLRRVHVGPTASAIVLSQSGRTLIVAAGREVVRVGVRDGHVQRMVSAPFEIQALAVSPSGNMLALAGLSPVAVINLNGHGRLRVIGHGDANVNPVYGVAWASPGLVLVLADGNAPGRGDLPGGLSVVDLRSGGRRAVPVTTGSESSYLLSLAVAPDRRTWFVTGAKFKSGGAQVAATWAIDARSTRVRWVADGPVGAYACPVTVSPNERLVAVGYCQGTSDVLDAGTGRLIAREGGSTSSVLGIAIRPAPAPIVTSSQDGVVRTWAAQSNEEFQAHVPKDAAIGFTPDGRAIVLDGARGELIDWRTGRLVRTFRGLPLSSNLNGCVDPCFGASASLSLLTNVDSASAVPLVREIDGLTGRRVASVKVPRLDTQSMAPDGQIVTAYVNQSGGQLLAQVIDPSNDHVRQLQPALSNRGCYASGQGFTPDGRLTAITDGCYEVVVWNLRSRRIVRTIVLPNRATGGNPALSPDGRYVLVALIGGAFVRVDLATGKVIERPGAATEAHVIRISPNGRWYAVGRQQGTVDVYDAHTLRLVREHTLGDDNLALAFSPSSQELAIEDTSGDLQVWDTCAICENPQRLTKRAAQVSVRTLTPDERAAFGVTG